MFRYAFNPYSLRWEIQLLRWGFIWRTFRGACFNSLAEAQAFTEATGIATHYREQRPFNHTPITQEQADEQP